ncbi:MAG: hypothetical protein AAFX04_14215 [Pseudomonadota bacterium]
MRNNGLWLSAPLFLTLGFVTPAHAQSIKPLEIEPDENGVDLLTGRVATREPALSIPAAGNLRFTRMSEILPIMIGEVPPGVESSYQINGGGSTSESLVCLDGECQSRKQNGSTLTAAIQPGGNSFHYYQGGTNKQILFDKEFATTALAQGGWRFVYYPSWIQWTNGERHTYFYDTYDNGLTDQHRPNKITSNLGYEMRFTYQSNTGGQIGWRIVASVAIYKTSDPNNALASLTYSGNTVTDISGRTWDCGGCSFSMDAAPQVNTTSLQLPGESTDSYVTTAVSSPNGTYGQPIAQVVRDGTTWNYSYQNLTTVPQDPSTPKFDKITVSGPSGFTRSADIWHPASGSSAAPRITKITNGLGQETSYTHDGWGRLTSITQPEGNSVSVTYDPLGNITEKRTKNKSGTGDLIETAYYASSGATEPCTGTICFRPNWTQDAAGNQTDYTWAEHGGMLTRLEPADRQGKRRKTIYEYTPGLARVQRERICSINSDGSNDTCGTADEQVTEYSYWGNSFLPLTVTRTNGTGTISAVTTNSYDNAGRMVSSDGPLPGNGDATYYRYDSIGRRTWEIGPEGTTGATRPATVTTYRDADDQPLTIETGTVSSPTDTTLTVTQAVDHAYDANRLRSKTEVSSGATTFGVTQFSYNARNQLECSAVRMNPAEFGSLPASACAPDTAGSDGPDRIMRTSYDVLGRPVKTVGGYGVMNGGDGNVEIELGYTNNGQVQWRKDGNGNKTQYVYDPYDRNNYIYYPHKTNVGAHDTSDSERFAYDTRGNVIAHFRRDGRRIYYDYDDVGRNWRKRYWDPALGFLGGEYLFYGYDGLGRPTYERRGSAGGQGLTHSYDGLGRLASTTDTSNGGSRTLSYQYDIAGRRIRVTHPDSVYFTYDYSPAGQLTAIDESGSTNLVSYSYDGLGRMTALTRANGISSTMAYDPVSRPVSYDHSGVTDTDFAYNAANQIISRTLSNTAYAWGDDANADNDYAINGLNQYTGIGPSGSPVSHSYDGNGNLTGDGSSTFAYDIDNRLTAKSGGTAAMLDYDPKGRLSRLVSGGSTTRFLYDGDGSSLTIIPRKIVSHRGGRAGCHRHHIAALCPWCRGG